MTWPEYNGWSYAPTYCTWALMAAMPPQYQPASPPECQPAKPLVYRPPVPLSPHCWNLPSSAPCYNAPSSARFCNSAKMPPQERARCRCDLLPCVELPRPEPHSCTTDRHPQSPHSQQRRYPRRNVVHTMPVKGHLCSPGCQESSSKLLENTVWDPPEIDAGAVPISRCAPSSKSRDKIPVASEKRETPGIGKPTDLYSLEDILLILREVISLMEEENALPSTSSGLRIPRGLTSFRDNRGRLWSCKDDCRRNEQETTSKRGDIAGEPGNLPARVPSSTRLGDAVSRWFDTSESQRRTSRTSLKHSVTPLNCNQPSTNAKSGEHLLALKEVNNLHVGFNLCTSDLAKPHSNKSAVIHRKSGTNSNCARNNASKLSDSGLFKNYCGSDNVEPYHKMNTVNTSVESVRVLLEPKKESANPEKVYSNRPSNNSFKFCRRRRTRSVRSNSVRGIVSYFENYDPKWGCDGKPFECTRAATNRRRPTVRSTAGRAKRTDEGNRETSTSRELTHLTADRAKRTDNDNRKMSPPRERSCCRKKVVVVSHVAPDELNVKTTSRAPPSGCGLAYLDPCGNTACSCRVGGHSYDERPLGNSACSCRVGGHSYDEKAQLPGPSQTARSEGCWTLERKAAVHGFTLGSSRRESTVVGRQRNGSAESEAARSERIELADGWVKQGNEVNMPLNTDSGAVVCREHKNSCVLTSLHHSLPSSVVPTATRVFKVMKRGRSKYIDSIHKSNTKTASKCNHDTSGLWVRRTLKRSVLCLQTGSNSSEDEINVSNSRSNSKNTAKSEQHNTPRIHPKYTMNTKNKVNNEKNKTEHLENIFSNKRNAINRRMKLNSTYVNANNAIDNRNTVKEYRLRNVENISMDFASLSELEHVCDDCLECPDIEAATKHARAPDTIALRRGLSGDSRPCSETCGDVGSHDGSALALYWSDRRIREARDRGRYPVGAMAGLFDERGLCRMARSASCDDIENDGRQECRSCDNVAPTFTHCNDARCLHQARHACNALLDERNHCKIRAENCDFKWKNVESDRANASDVDSFESHPCNARCSIRSTTSHLVPPCEDVKFDPQCEDILNRTIDSRNTSHLSSSVPTCYDVTSNNGSMCNFCFDNGAGAGHRLTDKECPRNKRCANSDDTTVDGRLNDSVDDSSCPPCDDTLLYDYSCSECGDD